MKLSEKGVKKRVVAKKILFVCKYNRFRSRIAEAYFKKINKNPNIKIRSGGILVGSYPLDSREVNAAKKLGIDLRGKPEPVTTEKLVWQDLLVIVADNVPKKLFDFNEKKFNKSTLVWNIPDIKHGEDEERIIGIIKLIMKKVEALVKTLE